MKKLLFIYSWLFIVLMSIGETVVLMTTEKYWPLSLDDYLGMAALAYATIFVKLPTRYLWMVVCYAAMAGNIYAMLFNRLDPIHGSGERIVPLIVILAYLSGGLLLSLIALQREKMAGAIES
jgi:hypothetical protein